MSIPFHKNQIVFSPSFECRSFVKGDVTVKGRIYGIAFVAAGVRLILSKNIRFVIGKVRNRKKESKSTGTRDSFAIYSLSQHL